jgi:hypothetical protein
MNRHRGRRPTTERTAAALESGTDPADQPSDTEAAGQPAQPLTSHLVSAAVLRPAARRRPLRRPRPVAKKSMPPARRPIPAMTPPAAPHTAGASTLHTVARAWRMRAVHAPESRNHVCGLCLAAWPCPPRTWADKTLTHHAQLDATG